MAAMPLFDRAIAFDGCFNFRDLGGYSTSSGARVRARSVYRADGPHDLSAADRVRLTDLRLKTIIDLRTPDEVAQRGCYTAALPTVVEHHLPMIDVLPDLGLERWVDAHVVARRYREMLRAGTETLADVLAILADPSCYPLMFHCTAGKDRTGIVAAVLLGVLGVPDDAIVADYALSGPASLRLVEHVQRIYPDAHEWLERVTPALIAAQPETMLHFLTELRREYGSFDGLADTIGVGTAPVDVREALLA
jgi:protein-tyrosine phosphatase